MKRDARKKTLHEGKLQGQFVEKTRNIAHEFSGKWIRNGFLKKETIKAKIDKQPVSPKCRLCATKDLVSGCPTLAQKKT